MARPSRMSSFRAKRNFRRGDTWIADMHRRAGCGWTISEKGGAFGCRAFNKFSYRKALEAEPGNKQSVIVRKHALEHIDISVFLFSGGRHLHDQRSPCLSASGPVANRESGFVSTDVTRKTQCWIGTSRSRRSAVCIHVHMCRADCHGRLRKILRKMDGCWRQQLDVVAVFCCSFLIPKRIMSCG